MKKKPSALMDKKRAKIISYSELKDLLVPLFKTHRYRLIFGFSALITVDLLQLVIPRLIKKAVDGLSRQSIDQNGLFQVGLAIVAIGILVVILRFCWRYLIIGFSRLLERAIRNRLFGHILKMDAQFFEKYSTGDLMAHLGNDLSAVQMACGMGMVAAADALVMSVAAIAFMIAIDPTLTLLALLPMPFLAISTRILSGKLHKRFATVQEQFADLTEFSRSTLLSIGLIKAYTMENFQGSRFNLLGKAYATANINVAKIQGLISPLASLVGSCGMLMILYFGGRLVINATISLGDFVAFITYLYMLIWPMMAIGWVANLAQRGLTSLGRIQHILNAEPSLKDNSNLPEGIDSKKLGFSLRNLTFTYAAASTPALSSINLEFPPGIYGITGRTGSGKSTLCKLLTRMYPLEDGMLYFADKEVNSLPLAFIRSHIGYVSQEPTLFSDSIAANIRLGRPESSLEEVEQAAKNAAIHADIIEFKDGYNTLIGERGVKLSGGQRQRLGLARALLCDRPILIIDDGLSAVDVATEHDVFNGIKQHLANKTVIIVSNRIKLLSMTDQITILKDGVVETQGTHDELLTRNPLYRTMHDKQMKNNDLGETSAP
ncbi:ABC transporter ATP-binding protein [Desulforhopalus sp. IMCC35007]|uniref:ABC transporter ATP-binding protein n=1 Tax=Desulforhopalus sp. IMCC35007 TaxID=2569543 RepID=UPI001F0FCAE4|nr:ABC transporter ATP-binding protein [Desulforhopalus sp. IMCC35007]